MKVNFVRVCCSRNVKQTPTQAEVPDGSAATVLGLCADVADADAMDKVRESVEVGFVCPCTPIISEPEKPDSNNIKIRLNMSIILLFKKIMVQFKIHTD